MRNTTKLVLLWVVLVASLSNLHAQTQITDCYAFFKDKGIDSNYLNNANDEWLICPDDSTLYLELTFTHVNIEAANNQGLDGTGCYDLLYIYDGKDDSSPLIGSFCGEESGSGKSAFISGHTLNVGDRFRSKNPDGCFFIRFESDQSKNLSGWVAEVTCCNPSLKFGLTDGIETPIPTNDGNFIDLVIDNSCTRYGNLSMFTEFEPIGTSCYTNGLTHPSQSFYAFTSNSSGGLIEFEIDSLDSVGDIEMIVYGPVEMDSLGTYVGGYINDCVSGSDPWALFFNAGPNQVYILGVSTEIEGNTILTTSNSTVGLAGVLPVKMIDYGLKKRGEFVDLTWTTAQELNNDKFEIYRSLDGKVFDKIGSLKAAENPARENTYTYSDHPNATGTIYYFVKQIDLDGRYIDYAVLSASISKTKSSLKSYPNPSVGSNFILDFDKSILDSNPKIQIFSSLGKEVINQTFNGNESVDFSNLEAGLYFIKISSGSTIMIHPHMIH